MSVKIFSTAFGVSQINRENNCSKNMEFGSSEKCILAPGAEQTVFFLGCVCDVKKFGLDLKKWENHPSSR